MRLLQWQLLLLILCIINVNHVTQALEVQEFYHSTGAVNRLAGPCPTASHVIGYSNLSDVHEDELAEVERIRKGETPRTPYIFVLCPNTTFSYEGPAPTHETLEDASVLNVFLEKEDVLFVCGATGQQSNSCILKGGEVSVKINSKPQQGNNKNSINTPQQQEIALLGITFQHFGLTSIVLDPESTAASLWLEDVLWENFMYAESLIQQHPHSSGRILQPKITIHKAVVRNGSTLSTGLFNNVGGVLVVNDMTVTGVMTHYIVRTSDWEGRHATTTVQNLVVSESVVLKGELVVEESNNPQTQQQRIDESANPKDISLTASKAQSWTTNDKVVPAVSRILASVLNSTSADWPFGPNYNDLTDLKPMAEFTLNFFIFDGHAPAVVEVNNLICEINSFFTEELRRKLSDGTIHSKAVFIDWYFDEAGAADIPSNIKVQFAAFAYYGQDKHDQVAAEVVLEAMQLTDEELTNMVENYVWESEPMQQNIFFFTANLGFNLGQSAEINTQAILVEADGCVLPPNSDGTPSAGIDSPHDWPGPKYNNLFDRKEMVDFRIDFLTNYTQERTPTINEVNGLICQVNAFLQKDLRNKLLDWTIHTKAVFIDWNFFETGTGNLQRDIQVNFTAFAYYGQDEQNQVYIRDVFDSVSWDNLELKDLLENYIWKSEPFGKNVFFYTESLGLALGVDEEHNTQAMLLEADACGLSPQPLGSLPSGSGGDGTLPPGAGAERRQIRVSFTVSNLDGIKEASEVRARGLDSSFPVFVNELVSQLTQQDDARQLRNHGRRLRVLVVPGTTFVDEVNEYPCPSTALPGMTCHSATGWYSVVMSIEEDPVAIERDFKAAAEIALNAGTYNNVLQRIAPGTPLYIGIMTSEDQIPSGSQAFPEESNVETPPLNTRAVKCPSNPDVIGYTSIDDLMQDQQDELLRLDSGESPHTPYAFRICPSSILSLDSGESVDVILPGSVTFSCGVTGRNSEYCAVKGGDVQVKVNPKATDVTFLGFIFSGFGSSSFAIPAEAKTKIAFNDTVWENFESSNPYAILLVNNTREPKATSVEVRHSTIRGGKGGLLFWNSGGSLILRDLTVASASSNVVVRTDNGGTTTAEDVVVTKSSLSGEMFHVLDQSELQATGVSVSQMVQVDSIFAIYNKSTADISAVAVENNPNWMRWNERASSMLYARDASQVSASNIHVANNNGMMYVFRVDSLAVMRVLNATVESTQGRATQGLLSSVALAWNGGTLNIQGFMVSDVADFSTVFHAFCGSLIQVVQSCIRVGTVETPMFISADSQYYTERNHIDGESVHAGHCKTEAEGAIFQEIDTPSCYHTGGNTTCFGSCLDHFSEVSECQSSNIDLSFQFSGPFPTNEVAKCDPNGFHQLERSKLNVTAANASIPGDGEEGQPLGNSTTQPVVVNFSFVVYNTKNLAASQLGSPEYLETLKMAFGAFVDYLFVDLARDTRRRARQLLILLDPESSRLKGIQSVNCPGNSTIPNSATCHVVHGEYQLLLENEDNSAVVSRSESAAVRELDAGKLQEYVTAVDPNYPFVVWGSTPEGLQPKESTDDDKMAPGIIVVIVLFVFVAVALLCCAGAYYFLRLRSKEHILASSTEIPSDKVEADGIDDEATTSDPADLHKDEEEGKVEAGGPVDLLDDEEGGEAMDDIHLDEGIPNIQWQESAISELSMSMYPLNFSPSDHNSTVKDESDEKEPERRLSSNYDDKVNRRLRASLKVSGHDPLAIARDEDSTISGPASLKASGHDPLDIGMDDDSTVSGPESTISGPESTISGPDSTVSGPESAESIEEKSPDLSAAYEDKVNRRMRASLTATAHGGNLLSIIDEDATAEDGTIDQFSVSLDSKSHLEKSTEADGTAKEDVDMIDDSVPELNWQNSEISELTFALNPIS